MVPPIPLPTIYVFMCWRCGKHGQREMKDPNESEFFTYENNLCSKCLGSIPRNVGRSLPIPIPSSSPNSYEFVDPTP